MTGSDAGHGGTDRARAWLGDSAQGGERLARLFRVGRAERVLELEAELSELLTRVGALQQELEELRRLEETEAGPTEIAAPATVELRRPPEPGERDYELHRCQGFEVYAGAERLGVVEALVYGSRSDRPDVLEVRSGRFGRRPLVVPVEEIEAIDPHAAEVVVSESVRSSATRTRLAAAVARLRSPLVHG